MQAARGLLLAGAAQHVADAPDVAGDEERHAGGRSSVARLPSISAAVTSTNGTVSASITTARLPSAARWIRARTLSALAKNRPPSIRRTAMSRVDP